MEHDERAVLPRRHHACDQRVEAKVEHGGGRAAGGGGGGEEEDLGAGKSGGLEGRFPAASRGLCVPSAAPAPTQRRAARYSSSRPATSSVSSASTSVSPRSNHACDELLSGASSSAPKAEAE